MAQSSSDLAVASSNGDNVNDTQSVSIIHDGITNFGPIASVLCLGSPCKLVLTEEALSLQVEQSSLSSFQSSSGFTVPLEDVIGLQVDKLPVSSLLMTCKTELCTYERLQSSSPLSSSIRNNNNRKLIRRELLFNDYGYFDDNGRVADEWREAIQTKRMERCRKLFVNTPERVNMPIEPLRLLVIINPFSGKKKSLKLYNEVVFPLFQAAGVIIVQELITERQGHATEFIKTFDLSTITGIVTASGDGIVYEVINGLMARPDWETAIKTPLGLLPTGSGNALVAAQLYEINNQEDDALLSAVFQIINGGIQSHSIASVITETSHMYMGVLINWGMGASIDIESERFRLLGGDLRFLLQGLLCIATKKVYRGRLSYLPLEEERGRETEGDGKQGREELELAQNIDTGDNIRTKSDTNATPPSTNAPPTNTSDTSATPTLPIPSLSDPIPSNWKTIEGNFIVFSSLMCSHFADIVRGDLDLRTDAEEQCILYTTDNVTRRQLYKGFSDPGGGASMPNFHTIRTKEYRLTPLSPGVLSVDGERVDYGPLHVQVHPGMMRLFSQKHNIS